ncbi:hypothetical protein HMI54_004685 [Coelomomyces lativittatus]|nr:hypothetical protein HMI56_001287 [Coelomomyces lativittatus]KAJ1506917.1 hypothetical protein HMI54_004685 [Coelomomyces lativittatus]KAJ1513708.1 hypothetical protein HMI55_005309 [Coelomomyces lativittatus]
MEVTRPSTSTSVSPTASSSKASSSSYLVKLKNKVIARIKNDVSHFSFSYTELRNNPSSPTFPLDATLPSYPLPLLTSVKLKNEEDPLFTQPLLKNKPSTPPSTTQLRSDASLHASSSSVSHLPTETTPTLPPPPLLPLTSMAPSPWMFSASFPTLPHPGPSATSPVQLSERPALTRRFSMMALVSPMPTASHASKRSLPEKPGIVNETQVSTTTPRTPPCYPLWMSSLKTQWGKGWSRWNPGLPLMVIQTLFSSIISLSVKILSSAPYGYPSYELVMLRSFLLFVISISTLKGYFHVSKDLLLGPRLVRKWILLRSLMGFVAVITYYASIQYLKLDEATLVAFTSPFFVGILGGLFLKETWEKVDMFAGFISLFGVLIIAKPDWFHLPTTPSSTPSDLVDHESHDVQSSSTRVMAFGLGLISSLSAAGVVILLRRLKEVPTFHLLTTFSWCAMLFAYVMGAVLDGHWYPTLVVPSSAFEVFMIVGPLSLSALVSQFCLASALRHETAAKCTSVSFLQLLFSFLLEIGFLNTVPWVSDYLGALIIIVGAAMVSIAKIRKERNSSKKKVSDPSQMKAK